MRRFLLHQGQNRLIVPATQASFDLCSTDQAAVPIALPLPVTCLRLLLLFRQPIAGIRIATGFGKALAFDYFPRFQLFAHVGSFQYPVLEHRPQLCERFQMLGGTRKVIDGMRVRLEVVELLRGHVRSTKNRLCRRELARAV